MGIEEFIRSLDNPKAPIAYPQTTLYWSDTGHSILGLNPDVQEIVRSGQPIVPPLQVIRRPGLGDKVFALSAVYALLQEQPDLDVTFAGLDTDSWLKYIPWVKTGINPDCSTVANLDNTPCNGGDRVQLMGEILGVDVTSIEFPVKVPRRKTSLKKPYFVFAPFAAQNGPRSLPLETTLEVLKRSPIPLAVVDSLQYDWEMGHNVTNCTGVGVETLISLIANSEGVIGPDTGVPWLAAAMGKPCTIFFSHVPKKDRVMTCKHVWGIDTPALCLAGCGDHIGTRPECRWKDRIPTCIQHLTPEFVRHSMREFERLVST